MTAAPAFASGSCPTPSRRARPRGLDRLVIRLSMTALLWARRRANRSEVQREHAQRMHRQSIATERREHEAALLAARVR